MNKAGVRMISLLLIVGILLMYNVTLQRREQNEKINDLQAQVSVLVKQQNELIKRLNASAKNEATATKEKTKSGVFQDYKDGTYEGVAQGFGGEIQVSITLEQGVLTSIQILSAANEDRAYLEMASGVVNEMLSNQSVEVDTVSGASFSSKGILAATKNALEKAKK